MGIFIINSINNDKSINDVFLIGRAWIFIILENILSVYIEERCFD